MRLISQDGKIDVPYENVCISIDYRLPNRIIAWVIHCSDTETVKMATYTTEAKAVKAMEMVREAYFNNKHEETYKDGVFDYAPNFKFPADDEIEV